MLVADIKADTGRASLAKRHPGERRVLLAFYLYRPPPPRDLLTLDFPSGASCGKTSDDFSGRIGGLDINFSRTLARKQRAVRCTINKLSFMRLRSSFLVRKTNRESWKYQGTREILHSEFRAQRCTNVMLEIKVTRIYNSNYSRLFGTIEFYQVA